VWCVDGTVSAGQARSLQCRGHRHKGKNRKTGEEGAHGTTRHGTRARGGARGEARDDTTQATSSHTGRQRASDERRRACTGKRHTDRQTAGEGGKARRRRAHDDGRGGGGGVWGAAECRAAHTSSPNCVTKSHHCAHRQRHSGHPAIIRTEPNRHDTSHGGRAGEAKGGRANGVSIQFVFIAATAPADQPQSSAKNDPRAHTSEERRRASERWDGMGQQKRVAVGKKGSASQPSLRCPLIDAPFIGDRNSTSDEHCNTAVLW
jgi:hypothetical protein